MSKQVIHPAKALSGSVQMPGDKSISHRYAMLAALAEGISELRNFAAAADCHSTLGCMKALGADVNVDGTTIRVTGHGLHGLKSSWRALDAGNSGTTIRLLSGILAGQDFTTMLWLSTNSPDVHSPANSIGFVLSVCRQNRPRRRRGTDLRTGT